MRLIHYRGLAYIGAIVLVGLLIVLVTGGASRPSDRESLMQACRSVRGHGYDWDFATMNAQDVKTGAANCGSDGSVASWPLLPAGRGGKVVVTQRGQPG